MTMKATPWCIALLIFSLSLLAACGGGDGEEGEAPEISAEAIEAGEEIFTGEGLCNTCHGNDGEGTELAPDLTDDEWINISTPVTLEKIETVVREGVDEPVEHPAPMPAMGGAQLTEEEVESVSAFVYELSN